MAKEYKKTYWIIIQNEQKVKNVFRNFFFFYIKTTSKQKSNIEWNVEAKSIYVCVFFYFEKKLFFFFAPPRTLYESFFSVLFLYCTEFKQFGVSKENVENWWRKDWYETNRKTVFFFHTSTVHAFQWISIIRFVNATMRV